MNVLLTGATGFVGAEVLTQLLAHPRVTHVTALTRRPLSVSHPKLEAILHADFTTYDASLVARVADHAACIWTLGGKASDFSSEAEYEKVTHGFTLALARALAATDRKVNFCYLSGMGADPGESTLLPWERLTRHLKGRTERDLSRLTENHPRFQSYAFRPGGILSSKGKGSLIAGKLLRRVIVRVDTLATAMIRCALDGGSRRTFSNEEIKTLAAV